MSKFSSVLVVDDEKYIRKILIKIARQKGFDVAEASDGLEAINILNTTHFDIVISDIKMPELNGFELIKKVKEEHQNTKVLIISGYGKEISKKEVQGCGADCYITKPFKNKEIARALVSLKSK